MDIPEDEFGVEEEEIDEDEEEEDSAFASSNEDVDVEMADAEDDKDDPPPPHLRPDPIPTSGDDEDGAITTNLEDDLENEGYTLPAVERGGEPEEFENGTSLRDVEERMRWLVGICMGKDEKVSNGVPGK